MENENIEKQEFFKTYLGIKNKNVLSSLEQMAYVWKVKDKEVGISNLSVNVKSLLTIESISSCTMLCVPIPELLKLIEQSPEMMRLYNRALSLAYKKLIEHEDIVANHRAKERYQYFVDTYRDLVDVVSKKDIASYLHLTPESLSRVLKSYKEEK